MRPRTFHDLKVWQLAHKLSLEVSQLVKTFPSKEIYRLVDQMIRAARSVPANIAEGFGRFHYNDKLTFYERASTSLDELDNHFAEALGNKYITEAVNIKFIREIKETSFLLKRMMRNIKLARDDSSRRLKSSRRLNSKPKA